MTEIFHIHTSEEDNLFLSQVNVFYVEIAFRLFVLLANIYIYIYI